MICAITSHLICLVHKCQLNFKRTAINPLDYYSDPHSIAIGDFNNDTWLDFVVTNRALNGISVFLASTNGTFTQPTTYATGSHSLPGGIAVADLNNDQHLDIVVASFGSNTIGVFLGMDNGTFINYTNIFTGSSRPLCIHIAHLDNNTFLDLVTADYGTDSISIYTGHGRGIFSYRMRYSTGFDSSPVSVVSADLNNDSYLDLAIAHFGTNNVGIFYGKGNGEFFDLKTFSTGIYSCPNSIVIGHLNSDNLLDIAVANYGTKNVGVFLNTRNDTYAKQRTYPLENASPYFIAINDINIDGQFDLVVTNRGTNNIGILLGYGNGSFSRPINLVTGSVSSISMVIADLNKDGFPDVVVISNDTSSVNVFFGKKEGFGTETIYSTVNKARSIANDAINDKTGLNEIDVSSKDRRERSRRAFGSNELCQIGGNGGLSDGSYTVAVGDFNGDGYLDLVVDTFTSLRFFLGHNDGTFTYGTIYSLDHGVNYFMVADLNSDGLLDVVVSYYDVNGMFVEILFGNGNGSFAGQVTHRTGDTLGHIAVGDFNNDKRSDVVVVDSLGDIFTLLGTDNGSFINQMTYSTGASPQSIAVGDFNNDTRLDIVVGDTISNNIGVLFGYGNGTFAGQMSYPTRFSPSSIVVCDLNSDTILDLIVTNDKDHSVSVFFGFGNGSFQDPFTFPAGETPWSATVGHFNNDDQLDIVVIDSAKNQLLIFFGDGNGSFVNHINCSTGLYPNSAVVGDFNNDGRSDIAVTNRLAKYISVFIYKQIQFTAKGTFSGSANDSRLKCIGVNDFNNDNILDIVVVNYGTKNIVLLLGHGDGSFEKQTVVPLDWNSNPQTIAIADFDKDNQTDLVIANSGTSNIDLLLGDGRGALTRQRNDGYTLNHPPSIIVADDFNRDGQVEVVVTYENMDNIDLLDCL